MARLLTLVIALTLGLHGHAHTCRTLKQSYKAHECCNSTDRTAPLHASQLCMDYEEPTPDPKWPSPDQDARVESWWANWTGYNPAKKLNGIYDIPPSIDHCFAYRYMVYKLAEGGFLPLGFNGQRITNVTGDDGSLVAEITPEYTFMDWFVPWCAKIRDDDDMSEVPAAHRGDENKKAYNGLCNWMMVTTINSHVEEHSALFRGGTYWFSNVMTADVVENIPSYLTDNGGLLSTQQKAAVDMADGPWTVNKTTNSEGEVVQSTPTFPFMGFSFPGSLLRLNEFHMMNAMNNLPFTGYAQKFLDTKTQDGGLGDFAYKNTGLKKDEMRGAFNYYPILTAPEVVLRKSIMQFVPKYVNSTGAKAAMLPYMLARKIFYKKAPAACTAGFRAGFSALNTMYKMVAEEQCPSQSRAIDLTHSLAAHWGTSEKVGSIPIEGDAVGFGRWSIPIYTPGEIEKLDQAGHAIACDMNERLHAYGCNIWVNASSCEPETIVDVVNDYPDLCGC